IRSRRSPSRLKRFRVTFTSSLAQIVLTAGKRNQFHRRDFQVYLQCRLFSATATSKHLRIAGNAVPMGLSWDGRGHLMSVFQPARMGVSLLIRDIQRVMSEQSEFWSKVAGRYDSVIDLQVGADTRWRVRERIQRHDGRFGAAAEFGCGTGFFT